MTAVQHWSGNVDKRRDAIKLIL